MRTKVFFKRHGSTILTCVGAIGVITTSFMSAMAATKASHELVEAKERKGEDLTKIEMIKVAAPLFVPPLLLGVATISCAFGANALSKKQQASLAGAYVVANKSYKEYYSKVKEIFGEAAKEVDEALAREHCPRRF